MTDDHIGDWLMTDPDIAQALGVKLETWLNRVYEGTHPPCIRIRGLSRRYWQTQERINAGRSRKGESR